MFAALIAFFAQRRKTWAALASVLLTWSLAAYFPDGIVTRAEWAVLVVGLAGVFGVHSIANDPLSSDSSGPSDSYEPLFSDETPPPSPLVADPAPLAVIPTPPAAPVPIAA